MPRLESRGLRYKPFDVIGFDPGGTTGWARARYLGPEIAAEDLSLSQIEFTTGEFGTDKSDHHLQLMMFIGDAAREAFEKLEPMPELVFEPFTFRQFARQNEDDIGRMGLELISKEYIGVGKLAAQNYSLLFYEGFNAGDTKDWCPNEKLAKVGWLRKPITPLRHQNDASRQVVKYLVVKHKIRHPITTTWRD
jgi:hypothetical protein